jgi:hypothetical protein
VNKSIKKITGILLTLISFVFLVWCFLAHPSTLAVRLLLNFIGFIGFASGLHLAGVNLFGFGVAKSSPAFFASLKLRESMAGTPSREG